MRIFYKHSEYYTQIYVILDNKIGKFLQRSYIAEKEIISHIGSKGDIRSSWRIFRNLERYSNGTFNLYYDNLVTSNTNSIKELKEIVIIEDPIIAGAF